MLFDKPTEKAEVAEEKKEEKLTLTEIKEKLENDEKDEEDGQDKRSHMDTIEGVVAGVTVMVSCMVFFLLGGVWGLWHPAWLVFFAIPVIPTIPAAIKAKDPNCFCFPVLITGKYLLFGFLWGIWHPAWVIFFTIPIYYIIADFIKKNRTC